MLTKEITFDSFNKIKSLWGDLTPEDINILEDSGIITKEIEHYTNLFGRGNKYTGYVEVRYTWLYKETNEVISVGEWYKTNISEQKVYETLGFGISNTPEVLQMIIEANGGEMPNILPPEVIITEPPIEPVVEPVTPSIVIDEISGTTETISGTTETISGTTENITGTTETITGTTETIIEITGTTETISGTTETISGSTENTI